jgi:hypothetical protein
MSEPAKPLPNPHRCLRGLHGYLIRFAPHAFAPQRQRNSGTPLSPDVLTPAVYGCYPSRGHGGIPELLSSQKYRCHPRYDGLSGRRGFGQGDEAHETYFRGGGKQPEGPDGFAPLVPTGKPTPPRMGLARWYGRLRALYAQS